MAGTNETTADIVAGESTKVGIQKVRQQRDY